MKFKTAITHITNEGEEYIRGNSLEKLIQEKTFVEVIVLLLLGKLPNEKELRMWDAFFVSAIDHGPAVASALNARISASTKNSMHTALAAGLLGLGERHGLAIEPAMKFFQDNCEVADLAALLKTMKEQKKYAPGFGHRILKVDARANTLLSLARENGFYGKYCEFAERVREELNSISSKPLPLNIDGAMAAILLDMGVDPRLSKGIFMISRVPGLVGQIYEEMVNDEGMRRLENDEIEYIGENI